MVDEVGSKHALSGSTSIKHRETYPSPAAIGAATLRSAQPSPLCPAPSPLEPSMHTPQPCTGHPCTSALSTWTLPAQRTPSSAGSCARPASGC